MTELTSKEYVLGIIFSLVTSLLLIMAVLYMYPENFKTELIRTIFLIALICFPNQLMTLWVMEQIKK